ncbi:hypothetical protein FRC12_000664 [Ceratobasidium sp. 428]|nr:hypothetical protein FRC12_000664 [Ceratobasidium sp. 428]
MFPHSHANRNRSGHQTRTPTPTSTPSVISSSSIRYATPASLPPAFGIEPLHMWENTVATSTSSRGPPSSYAHSEFGTRYTPNSRMISPQTPISTAEWVQQTSSATLTPSVYNETHSASNSYASTATQRIQAPNFGDAGNHRVGTEYSSSRHPVLDDSALDSGNFDVDASVPSSDEEEEEKSVRPTSKYIDDAAQESGGGRKRKRSKPQPSHAAFRDAVDDAEASSEEEVKIAKRRKDTHTLSTSKKKTTNKATKPSRSPNKSNRKQSRQVESEVENEESSKEDSFVPPASKSS